MRTVLTLLLLAGGLFWAQSVGAEELKSGPQPGDSVGPFHVEKCAGNEEDGVSNGDKLCYRCKLGSRPVVAVFAHTADASLAELVKELDGVVAKHEDKKFASFVNLLGKDMDALKNQAGEVVSKSGAKHIAVVIPEENENGPADYKLNPKADVTVLVYKGGTVKANFAIPSGGLKKDTIRKIAESAEKLVN